MRLLNQQLMEELSSRNSDYHLKQSETAEILMVSRPGVSDVVNKNGQVHHRHAVEMLSRIGKPRSCWPLIDVDLCVVY